MSKKNKLLAHILPYTYYSVNQITQVRTEKLLKLKFLEDSNFLATLPCPSAGQKDVSFEWSRQFGFDFLCIHIDDRKRRVLVAVDTSPASLRVYHYYKPHNLNMHMALWNFQGSLILYIIRMSVSCGNEVF